MAWITYSTVDTRWPLWENFSPYPAVGDAVSAQAWCTALITDAQAELETFIPEEFQDEAAATTTPAALASACYIRTRAKILDWFYSTKGRGSAPEDIELLLTRSQSVVENWVIMQQSDVERAGVNMRRIRKRDAYWQFSEDEDVGADYEID